MCEWYPGYRCTAPDTNCPHWIGTVCELDAQFELDYPSEEATERMLIRICGVDNREEKKEIK